MAMTASASQRRGSGPADLAGRRSSGATWVVLIDVPSSDRVRPVGALDRYVTNSDRPSQDDPKIVHPKLTNPTSARMLRPMGVRQPAVAEVAGSDQWEALWPADLTL